MRKFEVKEWLTPKLKSKVISTNDHDRYLKMLDDEIFRDEKLTTNLKVKLGMIEPDTRERDAQEAKELVKRM